MATSTNALQALADFGIFNDEAVSRLASLIESLQAVAGAVRGSAPMGRRARRGRPRGAARVRAAKPGKKRRAPAGKFEPSKSELASMRKTMTTKQIAEQTGVSMATVNLRIRKFGLQGKKAGRRKMKKAS